MPADKRQIPALRQFDGLLLVEDFSPRGCQDHMRARGAAGRADGAIHRRRQHIRPQDDSAAAAIGRIVHRGVTVGGVVAEVDNANGERARLLRAAKD